MFSSSLSDPDTVEDMVILCLDVDQGQGKPGYVIPVLALGFSRESSLLPAAVTLAPEPRTWGETGGFSAVFKRSDIGFGLDRRGNPGRVPTKSHPC